MLEELKFIKRNLSRNNETSRKKLKIVCISDTHTKHRQIPYISNGDILIHAGDFTYSGEKEKIIEFNEWLGELKQFRYKVVIAGNHDTFLEKLSVSEIQKLLSNCIYLHDSEVTIDGIRIWGSPWQPTYGKRW